MLHKRSQVLGSLHSAKEDDPALDGFPVFILRAVEEGIPLCLRHLQDGSGLAPALPFLRPCVDWLSGDFRDCGSFAGIGHLSSIVCTIKTGSPAVAGLDISRDNSFFWFWS